MARPEQETLPVAVGLPRRRWCKKCRQPLTDPISRLRSLGPECDPDRRTTGAEYHVDQDTLPGT